MTDTDDSTGATDRLARFDRRGFLAGATALGLGGTALAQGAAAQETAQGDPWTDSDFASTFVVFQDGDAWKAFNTATWEIQFEDADGAAVVNQALEAMAISDRLGRGVVRVTAPPGGAVLESDTTIEHTHAETGLILEEGVTLLYTGEEAAIDIAENGLYLDFWVIDASGGPGKYCIRDIGTGTSHIDGYQLRGASESLWFTDTENFVAPGFANNYVNIRWLLCVFGYGDQPFQKPTPHGITLSSSPNGLSEGHRWDIGVVLGPAKKGVVVGSDNEHDSIGFNTFYVDVDPLGGGVDSTEVLVEVNDEQNGVIMEGYTPAPDGDWDVIVRRSARDSYVNSTTDRRFLRVKREAFSFTDLTKFDPHRHERLAVDVDATDLPGLETETSRAGRVTSDRGAVSLHAGSAPGGEAVVRKFAPLHYDNPTFQNTGTLQTHVRLSDAAAQEGWLVWGARDGPAVGWRVVDDRIEGYVSDGSDAATVPLVEGFDPGTDRKLTAFYNPPTDVHYYLGDPIDYPDETVHETVSSRLPYATGAEAAERVLTAALSSSDPGDQTLTWANWRNYQYPIQSSKNPFHIPEVSP